MLQKLTIKNFQAHKKLEIDLDPHVTTIVGPNDTGKSAVIRALMWLATNRPAGDTFIRHGCKSAEVLLTVDGQLIQRGRGKSDNSYSLDDQEFKAFGNDVPPEISELLNLSDINFQKQHDNPFWFCETAGEVSRQLNRIVNLDIIDRTLSNLDREGRDARAEIKVLEKQLEEAKASRSSLSWVRKADRDLTKVEGAYWGLATATMRATRLRTLARDTGECKAVVSTMGKAAEDTEEVIQLGIEWKRIRDRATQLDRLIIGMKDQQAVLDKPLPDIEPLIELKEGVADLTKERKQLKDLISDTYDAKESVWDLWVKAEGTQKRFENEMGDICPLCEK